MMVLADNEAHYNESFPSAALQESVFSIKEPCAIGNQVKVHTGVAIVEKEVGLCWVKNDGDRVSRMPMR